jgi:hypothetical protein
MAGGVFRLWDDSPVPVLLLEVALGGSAIVGPLGAPATGAVFSTTFSTPIGGTLAPLIVPGTVSMSIGMGDIDGGAGLSVSPFGSLTVLNAFTADATKLVAADRLIPEPTTALMLVLGTLVAPALPRRRA